MTLINEKKYKNGAENINVPLKSLIAASNEVPDAGQGLEALYDRFILRLPVMPISDIGNFNQLLNSKPSIDKPSVDAKLKITYEELKNWQKQINHVELSDDSLMVINGIRAELSANFETLGIYVSDRRWQRAAILLKASAFCNGRNITNHSDLILLKYCLWTLPENREAIENIVMQTIKDNGFITDADIEKLDKQKDSLEKEINKELYHNNDVYDVVTLKDNKIYFKVDALFKSSYYNNVNQLLYIPYNNFKKSDEFNPVDENGNSLHKIICQFDNQGTCGLSYNQNYYDNMEFTPNVLFHKGDKKKDINKRLINSLSSSVCEIRKELNDVLKNTELKFNDYKLKLASHFATEDEINIAVTGIMEQIKQLKLRIKDCERLESLCK